MSMLAGLCESVWSNHPTVGFSAETAGPAVTIPATTLPTGSGAVALPALQCGSLISPGNDENHHHSHETARHQHLKWDLILEIDGEWQEKQKIAVAADQNGGGTLVYLSPG